MKRLMVFLSTVMCLCLRANPLAAAEPDEKVILDVGSHWRVEQVSMPPVVRLKTGTLVPLSAMKGNHEKGGYKLPDGWAGKLPEWPVLAADWMQPGVDESTYGLGRGSVVVNNYYIRSANDGRLAVALVRTRGKFVVNDPAGVKELTLDLRYQGGAIVYLNGKEVARGHLAAGAPVTPDLPGDDYPDEAVITPDGRALSNGFGDPGKYKDRFAKRTRELAQVKIPGSALVKGVNVLAVEVHRSPMPEVQVTSRHAHKESWWTGMELSDIRLTAPAGSAVEPNAGLPSGLVAWTCSPSWRVGKDEMGDRTEIGRPLRIVAARNGVFSGQAVAISGKAMGAFRATMGDLKTADGKGAIPAAAIRIRYALPDCTEAAPDNGSNGWFDGLDEEPPAEVPLRTNNWRPWEKSLDRTFLAVQPVWVTVRVPANAPVGDYRGTLKIDTGNQGNLDVPVVVKVHGWTAPDSKHYATFVEMNQSPESLAQYYKVSMWSEEHWKLIDKSFEQIGGIGGKVIYIPVIARARFGNEHGMIRWVKRGDSWDYDTALMEKYLDLAIKHLGNAPVVNFHISEPNQVPFYWKVRKLGEKTSIPPLKVTGVDPKTGELTHLDAPVFGTPASVTFWKPVFDRIRSIMDARGLKGSMMVGTEHDLGFHAALAGDLKPCAADFRWVSCTHGGPNEWGTTKVGLPLGYAINVWQGCFIPEPGSKRLYGWQWIDNPKDWIHASWPRTGLQVSAEMGKVAGILERLIVGGPANAKKGYPGLGYQGADFWKISADNGKSGNVLDKFPEALWGSLNIENGCEFWLRPGAKGPLGTARLEVLREGIEEANARATIERALLDPTAKARLGNKLAADAQALLDSRTRILRECLEGDAWSTWLAGLESRRDALFATAAEVQAKCPTGH